MDRLIRKGAYTMLDLVDVAVAFNMMGPRPMDEDYLPNYVEVEGAELL